jgi:hypothetical protein
METKHNFTKEEVINLSHYFNLEPNFNKVIITLNTEELDGNLVLSDNVMSEKQFVVAKGATSRFVEVNDEVLIDIEKMMIKEQDPNNPYEHISRIKIVPIEFDGYTFGIIDESVIKAKIKNQ